MKHEGENWFRDWFNSPYYHLLYKHRDADEAGFFLNHILDYLQLKPDASILDIPCGNGRHSLFLKNKGFNVTGMDLSESNIETAKSNAENNIQFYVHDMRQHIGNNIYDCIFNIFTSLGYFKWKQENFLVIKNMAAALKTGAALVIDFFNPEKVSENLKSQDLIELDGISFQIQRKLNGNRIVKSIRFQDNEIQYHYEENVEIISKAQFEEWFKIAGLQLTDCFGSYDLLPYNPDSSDRLIFILKKA